MKKIYFKTASIVVFMMIQSFIVAQCATTANLGSSSNLFTIIRNSTNPIIADNNLNTILYAHRSNTVIFGGDNGELRYDISTNGGTTWTNNVGVLNPLLTTSVSGRYPNMAIYNPVGNLVPNNAYLSYMAATVDYTANLWTGRVSGVRQLSGVGNTENYNQTGGNTMLIPQSLVKGAPGVFWAVDALYAGSLITGYKIYKGTWNGLNDIVWTTNYSVTPTFVTGNNNSGDYNIAFDPTGNIGYLSILGHITGGPTNSAFYPILYKTTDAGLTWTGPVQVDINQFSCITSNMVPGNVPSCAFEHDLTVDILGNPHILTGICNGNNAYSIFYNTWHHMFDITSYNGLWNAYDVANVNAGRGTFGLIPNQVFLDFAPQISRSNNGQKIFYGWVDNSTYTLGAPNQAPNLFVRGFDVVLNKWTTANDVSSCNAGANGLILFPHISPEVLQPNPTSYKLPFVFGEFTVPNDAISPCNFKFVDNVVFNNADFSINQPMASVSIVQGSTALMCPPVYSLSIIGAYDAVLWSNGGITNTTTVNAPGIYIVTVRSGCTINADTITVNGMTVNLTPTVSNVCLGQSTTLTVSGNAFGYTWTPGNVVSTSVIVTPSVTTIYTVNASGTGCTYPQTVAVNIVPTLSISGNPTVCAGSSVVLTASGANTYSWSNGVLTASANLSPSVPTVYTVVGTATNLCTNSITINVSPVALPVLTVSGTQTVCLGSSVILTANGANTYSWSNGALTSTASLSPSVLTNYTVVGTATNLCVNTTTINVTPIALPNLSITGVATVCLGGPAATLIASGANTYSWSNGPATASNLISPTITTVYTVTGTSGITGCDNTATINVVVSVCNGLIINNYDKLFIIYPNPSSGKFVVELNEAIPNTEMILYNSIGQMVYKSNLSEKINTINVNELQKGIYQIVISQNKYRIKSAVMLLE